MAGAANDEEPRFSGKRLNLAVLTGRRFQKPQRGRADSHQAPAGDARRVERSGGVGGYLAPLRVHAMLGRVLGFDRQERAGTDMQRDEMARDAARIERREQALGKMQARRRRGDRTLTAGINRLVTLGIFGRDRTLAGDVWLPRVH